MPAEWVEPALQQSQPSRLGYEVWGIAEGQIGRYNFAQHDAETVHVRGGGVAWAEADSSSTSGGAQLRTGMGGLSFLGGPPILRASPMSASFKEKSSVTRKFSDLRSQCMNPLQEGHGADCLVHHCQPLLERHATPKRRAPTAPCVRTRAPAPHTQQLALQ
eukprot:CAMPEP_0173329412 /NCGR_PEP_ID=MMETSP1144-20121109/2698_1 /TAXON_ID=483371 /ORGANISM="non described non described, Strain CCMP2298" /LENGTH=160 /DNA_ID=CAMNT_0014274013 /DNA_START=357 /DNA_END=841 /DNA_ORIENTATION=+